VSIYGNNGLVGSASVGEASVWLVPQPPRCPPTLVPFPLVSRTESCHVDYICNLRSKIAESLPFPHEKRGNHIVAVIPGPIHCRSSRTQAGETSRSPPKPACMYLQCVGGWGEQCAIVRLGSGLTAPKAVLSESTVSRLVVAPSGGRGNRGTCSLLLYMDSCA
jgi:hypothetical protein